MDLSNVLPLLRSHAWLALAVLVVGYLVRLTGKDSKFWVNVPEQWQPVVVLGLGTLADVLQKLTQGIPWDQAINAALVLGVAVLALKAYFHGREPRWLQWLAFVVPMKTTTDTVTGPSTLLVIPEAKGSPMSNLAVPEGGEAKVEITKPDPEPKDAA